MPVTWSGLSHRLQVKTVTSGTQLRAYWNALFGIPRRYVWNSIWFKMEHCHAPVLKHGQKKKIHCCYSLFVCYLCIVTSPPPTCTDYLNYPVPLHTDLVPVPPVYSLVIVFLIVLLFILVYMVNIFFLLSCTVGQGLVSKHFTVKATLVVFGACDK